MRFDAGQASFDEVREQVQEAMSAPKMEPKIRELLTKLRQDAFLEIKDGYLDTGAAPGKDTRWRDVAQLKPQTTTKEQVASERRHHKHLLFIPIPKTTTVKGTKKNVDPDNLAAEDPSKSSNAGRPSSPEPARHVAIRQPPRDPCPLGWQDGFSPEGVPTRADRPGPRASVLPCGAPLPHRDGHRPARPATCSARTLGRAAAPGVPGRGGDSATAATAPG